ncbi:MAG: 2,4-diaminopentanoate dehydrogenase [Eubacteriales bacterium]|nr:2,4-diaminopentanoate dehydrogenase [Eubacteriales bacterium]
MREVRVVLWGLGAMGSGIARLLSRRKGVLVVGACDINPDYAGRNLYDALNIPREGRPDAPIKSDILEALANKPVDVCVIATNSFVKDVYPKVLKVVAEGVNVLTIAEEMAWPWAQSPDMALDMHIMAVQNKVSVLGTGINPGMMMDLLAVCLSGAQTELSQVHCERVNSLSPFGKAVMEEQGIGITPEAFEQGVSDGSLAGHVGFEESIHMMASAFGWPVEEVKTRMRPIITQVDRKASHGEAKAGQVAGVDMTGQGIVMGEEKITMRHPQQIEPQLAGVETGDYITLKGAPPIEMAIRPEVDGGLGTIAMACNTLPFVVAAKPGLLTMLDLPVPRCVMGDYRAIAFGEEMA